MARVLIFLSGLLFGAGIALSGMINPMKVQNFMDLAGSWDPTLLLVMGGGLLTTLLGYRLAFGQAKPWLAPRFQLPPTSPIDAKLVAGAAFFGLGWGLSGFCPGPAVASLVFGHVESIVFVIAMAAGMLLVKLVRWLTIQSTPIEESLS